MSLRDIMNYINSNVIDTFLKPFRIKLKSVLLEKKYQSINK